jgi:hypothetical protein
MNPAQAASIDFVRRAVYLAPTKEEQMARNKKTQFGALPPRYKFIPNPYPGEKISRCPLCERTSRQRKLPLLILIKP